MLEARIQGIDMDDYRKLQCSTYSKYAIKHPHYIKNHNEDRKNKRIAARLARRKLRAIDKGSEEK